MPAPASRSTATRRQAALGFREPTRNSLDSVSDRDFALEFLAVAAICATHLSRLAEEIVIWSTPQFGFVRLSDRFSTGSSIMPQKKNPDAAELVRAKTGRVNGHLIGLLTVMKGLPLTYSKDMQEDKEAVFDAAETLDLMLAAMTGMVGDMTIDTAAMKRAAGSGYSTATDLADWLVRDARPAVPRGPPRHRPRGRAGREPQGRPGEADACRAAGDPCRHHRGRLLGPVGAELGEEPHLLRRHRAGGGAQADPLLEEAPGQGVSGRCNADDYWLQARSGQTRTEDQMTAGRTILMTALAVTLCAVAACGRKAPLDTPYDAAVQARKDAERANEPLPPEPTPPVRNKPFVLDALID